MRERERLNLRDNGDPVLIPHTELGLGASQLSSLLTIETGGVCAYVGVYMCVSVCVCALCLLSTHVSNTKPSKLSTRPRGEGSGGWGVGLDRWTDGWMENTTSEERKWQEQGSETCNLGVKAEGS